MSDVNPKLTPKRSRSKLLATSVAVVAAVSAVAVAGVSVASGAEFPARAGRR